ncbi:MAG: hypothetical protein H6733_12675 [Alphaproteobacteria bacterium]|nr:hypothetical protein [Alphaproteobacteria bacterium]
MTATRYPGHAPWDEAWFLEGTLDDGLGVWLRYTVSDGVHPHVGVWAAVGPEHTGHRTVPLGDARWGDDPKIAAADAVLTERLARGSAGRIAWDLTLGARRAAPSLVPAVLDRLGVGRTYAPEASAVDVQGTLTIDGAVRPVQGRMVFGHLWGARSRVARWGWCHAIGFEDAPEVIFQALAAELGTPERHLPALTTLHLQMPGAAWDRTRPHQLITTRSRFDADRWSMVSRGRAVTIRATFDLGPPERRVLAAYVDPEGVPSWCRNTTFGVLTVDVLDRRSGTRTHLRTARALGEIAGRVRPDGDVVLPPSP